jgi:hypothetical protein
MLLRRGAFGHGKKIVVLDKNWILKAMGLKNNVL